MKKILLATTMLAMTVGYASAEVKISGSARMGLVSDGTDTVFSSRVRIVFDATGTTDGGLSFGASMRADQFAGNNAGLGSGGTTNGDSTVFVSGSFGKLTMGDVAGGAADELVGQVSLIGYTDLSDNGTAGNINFLGGTATAVRYDYTSGNLSVALGTSQTTAPAFFDKNSVAVKYVAGAYTVAVGYETVTGDNQISAKVGATFGAATVKLKAAKNSLAGSKTEWAASLDYAVNPALTVTAFYTDHATLGTKAMGLGASYDLGGGASVVGAVMDDGTNTLADFGVKMSF